MPELWRQGEFPLILSKLLRQIGGKMNIGNIIFVIELIVGQ